MLLIYLSCAWVVGIFLGSIVNVSATLIFAGLVPLPLLFLLRSRKKYIILTSIFLIILLGGIIRFQSSIPAFDENHLRFYNDRGIIAIEGIVAGAVSYTHLTLPTN